MNTVVALRPRRRKSYTLDEEVMFDIRMRMHTIRAADLAKRAGISEGCVYAIKSGRTKWPRGSTLFAILPVLGIELVLIDAATGDPL